MVGFRCSGTKYHDAMMRFRGSGTKYHGRV